jgi:dihydrofolate synthase/folylpolyglutamate synthase
MPNATRRTAAIIGRVGGLALLDPIDWLYGLEHFGIKLGLDSTRTLLRLLDLPHAPCRFVQVAGTNGKGSVAAMLDAMLGAAGIRAGLFTSPHLVRPNERIRVGGLDIETPDLHRSLTAVRDAIERGISASLLATHPSFFEVATATALRWFAERRVDVAVLEVGLGGRLDATTAIDADVGVVVSIDLDHTNVLGTTLEEIAREKAGIVKPGMPLVSGVVQQRAIDVVRGACTERGATFIEARCAAELVADGLAGLGFRTPLGLYERIELSLAGRHQIDNARIALVAFETLAQRLGFAVDPAAVRAGLGSTRWPGRLQWIDPGDGGARLLLDGAHNPAGLRALAAHLDRARLSATVLLFGATTGRPVDEQLGALAGRVDHAVLTRVPVSRAVDPETIVDLAHAILGSAEAVPDPRRALARAREVAGVDRPVLVTGSLYLVGTVLAILGGVDAPGPVAL